MTNPTLRQSIALQCEECGVHGRSLDTRLCATCEPKVQAQRLGETVLRLVPGATPERVEALVSAGLAVERLDQWVAHATRPYLTPHPYIEVTRNHQGEWRAKASLGWCDDSKGDYIWKVGASLVEAVNSALGEKVSNG